MLALGTAVVAASLAGLMHSAMTVKGTLVARPPRGAAASGPMAQDQAASTTATGCVFDLGLVGATLILMLPPPLDMHSRLALASTVGANTSRRPPRVVATESSAAPLLTDAAAAVPWAAAVPSAFL